MPANTVFSTVKSGSGPQEGLGKAFGSVGATRRRAELAARHLASLQRPDGHWVAELEGDCILESEHILLMAFLGRELEKDCLDAANYLLEHQNAEGGWSMYPGGPSDISGTVKAYFALKLIGLSVDDPRMVRAKNTALRLGGVLACNSFTKFYLALLGQLDYRSVPSVPPELLLLPKWFYVNLSAMSAWTRTIVVPLSIMSALKPCRRIEPERGIFELFLPTDPHPAPPCASDGRWFSWRNFFIWVDRVFKAVEPWLGSVRQSALQRADAWMRERFEDSDGLGAIFPPMIYTVVALKAQGVPDDDPALLWALQQIDDLKIREPGKVRLQPCLSPVWDTALALNALAFCGHTVDEPEIAQAARWLLAKEVRRKGDWAENLEGVEPGGWFFEYRNAFYPDTDDTAMVLMALARTGAHRWPEGAAACQRAIQWLFAMQNSDGGWAAFDRDINREILTKVPFADHNAMLDPSCADITARILEALGEFGYTAQHESVQRALEFLRQHQYPDGSWYGRWGVNHLYGTWQVLAGLEAMDIPPGDPMVLRGVQWLLAKQKPDGSWGESCHSYDEPSTVGEGESTPSQTAWGLLGLQAARSRHPEVQAAIQKGIRWLEDHQGPDGNWAEPQFTGTGFPRVFYLRYHNYRLYFPAMALARQARGGGLPPRADRSVHGYRYP